MLLDAPQTFLVILLAGSAEPAHCCLLTHRMGLFASLLVQAAKSQLRRQKASLGCGALEAKEHTHGTLPGKNLGCCRCVSKQQSGQSWHRQGRVLYHFVQGAAQGLQQTCHLKLR